MPIKRRKVSLASVNESIKKLAQKYSISENDELKSREMTEFDALDWEHLFSQREALSAAAVVSFYGRPANGSRLTNKVGGLTKLAA